MNTLQRFVLTLPLVLAGCSFDAITGYDCDSLRAEVVAIPDSKLVKIYDPVLVKSTEKLIECKGNGAFTDNTNYPLTYKAEVDKEGEWMISFDASEAINAEAEKQQAAIEQQINEDMQKAQEEVLADIEKIQEAAAAELEQAIDEY